MSYILGLESSCDDTSAAVLDGEGRVMSNVLASQDAVHAPYGGVVPELASRQHLRNMAGTVRSALLKANIDKKDLSAVAVTVGPGLLGSLLVGVSYAKAFAWGLSIPVYGINHVQAHLRSPWIEKPDLPYPSLGLAVSGGHSHLFLCSSPEHVTMVARTRDDAAGEALDKLAKRLNLPYPGGPVIDRLSSRGDSRAIPFTMPRMASGSLDYSFSGLKTAALHYMISNGLEPASRPDLDALPQWEYDLLASFQKRVVDHLLQRLKKAALLYRPASLVMAGGVACNSVLRARFTTLGEDLGILTGFPSPCFCSDNGAMIAFYTHSTAACARPSGLELDAFPTVRWEQAVAP
jgi:N6-L-threonylcarbamoyladenine synthase